MVVLFSVFFFLFILTLMWTCCCYQENLTFSAQFASPWAKKRSHPKHVHTHRDAYNTYRCFALEAGSWAGRSGLHGISGPCWVTQLVWSPLGLHLTNIYLAAVGAPVERKKLSLMSFYFHATFCARLCFRVLLSNIWISSAWQFLWLECFMGLQHYSA